jgi:glycosyl hydrolase family 39 (putative alpha-L-iduronidase)
VGLCEDYPEESRSLAEVQRDLALLKAASVSVLRVSIGWDGVEPEKDHYDLAFWDAFVDLAEQQGIRLIPYVAYTPRWNSDGQAEDYWKTPPRDVSQFGELMQLLATRYRGRIHSWELWNEPDNRDYWLGTAAQYALLLEAGAAAVHAVDPKLEVVSGGLAGGVPFLRELFAQKRAAAAIDIVNLHSYYETWNPNPLETIPSYVADVSRTIRSNGGKQRLWMAEVGYSNWQGPAAASAAPRYAYEHSADFQATVLIRTLALLFSQPAVSLVAWYELKDPRASDAMIGDDNNRHLGVTYADYRPKPALAALSFMTQLFSAGFREIDAELRMAPSSKSELELHGFVTGRRTLLLIAWLKTRSLTPVPNTVDARRERVQVRVPQLATGTPHSFDERGRPVDLEIEAHTAAQGTDLTFEVTGGEVRILELPIAGG